MTKAETYSPVVRQVAANLGIDLSQVRGTGPGGSVVCKDVYAASAARRSQAAAPPQPVQAAGMASRLPRMPAGANPANYAVNPLVDQVKAMPGGGKAYVRASANDPGVPTLFASGDLPPFTASGMDPSALLSVPWFARHAVAAAKTQEQAYDLVEAYSGPDGEVAASLDSGVVHHIGNVDYKQRVESWVMAGDTAAAAQEQERGARAAVAARASAPRVENLTDVELYDNLFGAADRSRAALREGPKRRGAGR